MSRAGKQDVVLPRRVSLFWLVVLGAISVAIFRADSPPWWLSGIGYLAALLAFGALLEFFKSGGAAAATAGSRSSHAVGLTEEENELLGEYGRLLENLTGLVRRESELPAPKPRLRAVLRNAREDPVFSLGLEALDRSAALLDTFVPDCDFEETERFVDRAIALAAKDRKSAYESLLASAPKHRQDALNAVVNVGLGFHS